MVTRRAVIAVVVALSGVVAAGVTGSAAAPAAGAAGSARPVRAPDCAGQVAEVTGAAATARACGHRVEVSSLRSEYRQTFVNADGTTTVEESVRPRWARRADRAWVGVDPSLRRAADGRVVPVATVPSLEFSGGGAAPFARMTSGGAQLSVSWPGPLPAPVLEADTAVYRDVLPGVDLRVTAAAQGFSHVLLVKDRAAAGNPALRELTFGLATTGLTVAVADGGALVARDPAGRTAFAAPAPLMWDAGEDSGAGGRRQAVIGVRVASGRLVLTPDRRMLEDPGARFPLSIDPSWAGHVAGNAWTTVWSKFPTSSFWQNGTAMNNAPTFGGSGSGRTCDRSTDQGVCLTSPYVIRSIFRMDLSGVQGKQISGATFRIQQRWAWTCNPATNAKLWLTSPISPSTTWNDQPWWDPDHTAQTLANHRVGGGAGCTGEHDVEFDVTGIVQLAVGGGWGDVTFGLRAVDEGTTAQWKRFDAGSPVLVIQYNTVPNRPDGLAVDGKACGKDGVVFVSTTTPTLRARVSDADGDSLQTWFAYSRWDPAQNRFDDIGGGVQELVPNGGVAQHTAGGLVDGGRYTFRVQTNDYHGGVSPVTDLDGCQWQVDLSDPVVPAVTADLYRENSAGCPPTGCGGVGQTGQFTFASSPDVASYRWGFTDPPSTVATPAAIGGSVTVAWTPTAGGPHTLYVQAVDGSGRTARKVYQFTVAGPAPAAARWRLDDPAGTTRLADSTGNGHVAILTGGTLGVPGRIPGGDTALSQAGSPDNEAYTPSPVIDTSRSFTVSTWAKLADKGSQWGMVYQDGTTLNAFDLEYNALQDAWKLAFSAADQRPTTWSGAVSTSRPALGVWTHVTGVYDAAAKEARLYVNGRLEGRRGGITAWNATGTLHIGRIGSAAKGSLSDIQVWNRVLLDSEVAALADPLLVGNVGEWHLDEVGSGPATDSSGLGHDLTLHGNTSIPPGGSGQAGTGLRLDGATGYTDTAGPVLYTDQSFTVSAWVRVGDGNGDTSAPDLPTGNRTAVGQSGQWLSAFFLGFKVKDGATRWCFAMKDTDSDGGPWVDVLSPTPVSTADVGRWVHLVGVFDAAAQRMSLYVNGALAASAARTASWHASGPLTVGAALWSPVGGPPRIVDHWLGDLDEVRVYAGAVADGAVR